MPCENLNNDELVDRLVEVTLELEHLDTMRDEVHSRVGQDRGQAPDVDRSVDDKEYLESIGRRAELDKLHVHFDTEIRARGLHDDFLKALEKARKRK